MAELITVARPYAEAIFSLSIEKNAYHAWSEALAILAYVAKDGQVVDAFSNPTLTLQAILAFLEGILKERMTDEVKNLMTLILANRRFVALPLIAQLYEAMHAQSAGIAKARVETAFALDEHELAELTAQLEKRFKQKIAAEVEVNPNLIGGVRVTVGDEVMDASINGKLFSLAASLKS
jgi:F-type H+-transporting ATPase subunit delta